MASAAQARFPCPHCGETIHVKIEQDVDTTRTETATQVSIEDMPPVRCPECGEYAQVKLADVVIEYEAVPIKIQ